MANVSSCVTDTGGSILTWLRITVVNWYGAAGASESHVTYTGITVYAIDACTVLAAGVVGTLIDVNDAVSTGEAWHTGTLVVIDEVCTGAIVVTGVGEALVDLLITMSALII